MTTDMGATLLDMREYSCSQIKTPLLLQEFPPCFSQPKGHHFCHLFYTPTGKTTDLLACVYYSVATCLLTTTLWLQPYKISFIYVVSIF